MTDIKHTPLPWVVSGEDESDGLPFIGIETPFRGEDTKIISHVQPNNDEGEFLQLCDEDQANAAFIVRACNAYYENEAIKVELLEALEAVQSQVDCFHTILVNAKGRDDNKETKAAILQTVRAAIARAKGGAA